MTIYVRLEFERAGISIDEAAAEMVHASRSISWPVMASFNGVWIRAEPYASVSDVVKQYMAETKFRYEAEQQMRALE